MVRDIRFDRLESALKELGFERQAVKGRHVLLEHPPTGTLVILPPLTARSLVDAPHLAAVRKAVIENGLADERSFEAVLEKFSRNGHGAERAKV